MRVSDMRSLALLVLLVVGAVAGLLLVSSEPDIPIVGPGTEGPSENRKAKRPDLVTDESERARLSEKPVIKPTLSRPRVFHTCLEGRVVGLPAEVSSGAWISVNPRGEGLRARLDAKGAFTIWNLPCDKPHSLMLGFGKGRPQVMLKWVPPLRRNETREVVLTLERAVIVAGRIEDDAGAPLAGIRLALVLADTNWQRPGTRILAVTGQDGRYVIAQSASGSRRPMTLVVDGTPVGRDVVERAISPAAGETHTCDVRLPAGLRIAGRVVGPGGKPLAGAAVEIVEVYSRERRPGEPIVARGEAKTDAHGHFMDDAYGPGLFRVEVRGSHQGHPFLVVRENVAAGSENLEIRFAGFGSIMLRFEDAKTGLAIAVGSGVLQRTIATNAEGDDEYQDWKLFSGKSKVKLIHIPAGQYRVSLSHIGYETTFGDNLPISAGKSVGPLVYKMSPR
jgi:hypothetical protein